MNEFKDTIKQLQILQEIRASEKLRKRISGLTYALPVEAQAQFMPGFAFAVLVMSVILLFVGVGSGFMLAAQKSKPGTPLYPVKQAIGKVQMPLSATIQEKQNPKVPTPTTIQVTPTQQSQATGGKNIQTSIKNIENSIQEFFRKNHSEEKQIMDHDSQQKNKEEFQFHNSNFKGHSEN